MNVWTYAYLVVGLLLLVAPACALIPDTIEIRTSPDWLTAGSSETATITVQVSNSTSGNTSFLGVAVDFAVNSTYGSISPAQAVTNDRGVATAVFTPATRSGNVTITAWFFSQGREVSDATVCRVDHAAASAAASVWYEPEVTVGEVTAIAVRVTDRYGNPVDSKREDAMHTIAETVHFMVGSPTGNATFIGATVPDDVAVSVDPTGNATAMLRVDTAVGENLVMIQPPVPGRSDYISIMGVAGGVPFKVTQVVDPVSASVPADGDKVVSLTYTLFDEYENPAAGQALWVNASIERGDRPAEREAALLYANSHGQVMITYGPEDSVGVATITATAAAGNPGVSVSQEVEFTSTEPVNMLLSASPQSMPSRDVKEGSISELRAKVMDTKGNPVGGENVTFEIVSTSCTPYVQTEGPALAATSADTDSNGYAVVEFRSGAFTTDREEEGWCDTATGTATVRAMWGNVSRDLVLTWKNYPYLSVETAVFPETVAVNETVDVTIRLKGDGWALQPDPIDVVLCTDRSGSMLYDNPDRMYSVREAAKMFVDQFSENHDRASTVSFGRNGYISRPGSNSGINKDEIDNEYNSPKTYGDYATLDVGLTYGLQEVKSALDGIVPDHGTPLRHGLKVSIDHLVASANDGSVRAVVLLTDGDYNWYGDPLARGSGSTSSPENYGTLTQSYYKYTDLSSKWQNMSAYAADNNISIFTISYSESLSSDAKSTLRKIAESTGGKYYHAPDPDTLGPIYTEIAGVLKTEAGVDTELDVVFENVEVNGALESGADVYDYVHEDGVSTTVESWVDNETPPYVITPKTTIDQTLDWNDDHNLNFDIGTVRLSQTWETTFRLKVKTDGNINIFGPGSTITFNNGEDTLTLPDTFITALPDLNNTGLTSCRLAVELATPIPPVGQDAFYDTLPLTWTVTYNGTRDIDEVLAYSNNGGQSWTAFWAKTVDRSTTRGETLMDVRSLPPGDYLIRLIASALDTPDAVSVTEGSICIGNASRDYIRIG